MDIDELIARLSVVESFSMLALGLYLANSRNDPDYQKAGALLDHLEQLPHQMPLTPEQKAKAVAHSRRLANEVRENLRVMRGEGGQAH
jgi:hypothetical protein